MAYKHHGAALKQHTREREAEIMRNVTATIEKGQAAIKQNERLDLRTSELQVLYENFNATAEKAGLSNAIWETIASAYKMGLAVGLKNADKRDAPRRAAERPHTSKR